MENLYIALSHIYDKSLKIMKKNSFVIDIIALWSMITENSHLAFITLSDIEKGKLCIFI